MDGVEVDNVVRGLESGKAFFTLFKEALEEQSQYADEHGVHWRKLGALSVYAVSPYGVLALLVAVIINRINFFASTNTNLRRAHRAPRARMLGRIFGDNLALAAVLLILRGLAISFLLQSGFYVLVALRSMAQTRDPSQLSRLTKLIPSRWFQYEVEEYAESRYMAMPRDAVRFGPSVDMLWPVFYSVSFSLFAEAFALSINGNSKLYHHGITLFELSLALHESTSDPLNLRSHRISRRPTEAVLMVCLFVISDHVNSQLMGAFSLREYALIPLTALSLPFVWYFTSTMRNELMAFPMNIAASYLMVVVVMTISAVCFVIFLLAFAAKGSRVTELNYYSFFKDTASRSEFFSKHLSISLSQDFYTAMLNLGTFAISLAGALSYFGSLNVVNGPRQTWVEECLLEIANGSAGTAVPEDLGKRVAAYFKENRINGYENFVSAPRDGILTDKEKPPQASTTVLLRVKYYLEIVTRFVDLVISMVWKNFFMARVVSIFRKRNADPVSERVPKFMRHLVGNQTPDRQESTEISETALLAVADDDDIDDLDYEDQDSESDADTINDEVSEQEFSSEALLEAAEDNQYIMVHVKSEKRLTRSTFREGGEDALKEADTILDLILAHRKPQLHDEVNEIESRFLCVICQENPREIITWPCKCLAICESCRLSLVAKGMEGCVCCRRDVGGVSKIFMP